MKTSDLGRAAGWVMAPVFGLVSLIRHARTFHPRGPTFHASVAVNPDAPDDLRDLGHRLVGPALVRFSGALWKHAEGIPDVLGCAIRLRGDERATAEPDDDDQDLLFATIKRPWTMPFSPLTTKVRDYLGNDYFAVSPFDTGMGRPLYFRLRAAHPSTKEHGSRAERLTCEVELGEAALTLAVSERPFGPWTPLADVLLQRVADVDGEELRFRPFRTGRGIRPHGFVHALRRGAYALSQKARPEHA